ncbi:MAG: PspA/IM30 family protein [Mariprofundus sp.]|nr:PspA/IM30 family protein [Mariprofundus sp.]
MGQNIFQKLVTLVRGGATKAGEAIIDANAITIFEQEIKDGQSNLDKAKKDLTLVMAKSMEAGRKISGLKENIAKHEGYVEKALGKGDEALALEVAGKIAEFEGELQIQEGAKAQFDTHIKRLKSQIKDTQQGLDKMTRELTMVKTTDSVQKASQAISQNYANSGSKALSAKESLNRIKARQQETEDRLAAGEVLRAEFEGESLEDKLRESGIVEDNSGAGSVLDRIKAKQNQSN